MKARFIVCSSHILTNNTIKIKIIFVFTNLTVDPVPCDTVFNSSHLRIKALLSVGRKQKHRKASRSKKEKISVRPPTERFRVK